MWYQNVQKQFEDNRNSERTNIVILYTHLLLPSATGICASEWWHIAQKTHTWATKTNNSSIDTKQHTIPLTNLVTLWQLVLCVRESTHHVWNLFCLSATSRACELDKAESAEHLPGNRLQEIVMTFTSQLAGQSLKYYRTTGKISTISKQTWDKLSLFSGTWKLL